MKCPQCGYQPKRGRPKKLPDKQIRNLVNKKYSLAEIAEIYGVTKGAIWSSLQRSKKGIKK